MPRPDARRALAASVLVLLVFLGIAAAMPGRAAPSLAPAPTPRGASALDALGELRDAESHGYNLAEDGVRTFAATITSPAIQELTIPGASLAGRQVELTLWWRDGESRVVVGGVDGLAPELVESLRDLVRPLPALLLPSLPSRGLVGSSFHARNVGSVVHQGDRGIEAIARDPSASIQSALFAVSAEGLIVGERLERADGAKSEFRHQWSLQGGRYLLSATEGWLSGLRVAAEIEWGALVGQRPVPTRVLVLQADIMAPWPEGARGIELRLSQHRLNAEPPVGLFAP